MTTFRAVNDETLIRLIGKARRRIVYIAPGLFMPVAQALCQRFAELGNLEVTLVLDADEDVCRIGFGELNALQAVHVQAQRDGFFVRAQPGLRVGVLLVDDQTLIWSPTPRAVEAPPDADQESRPPAESAPNGLLLGANPGEQIAHAVCAEGTDTDPHGAEIGRRAVTPHEVTQVADALTKNPPIPVDLARITRVFSTKLQFVELKVKGAKLAQHQLGISSDLLNADANEHLRSMLEGKLRAFADFKDRPISLARLVNGERVFDRHGQPLMEEVTEASLGRERAGIEAEFMYDVPGFGRLMERDRQCEFEQRVSAYKARVLEHSVATKQLLANETEAIIHQTVSLIAERVARSGSTPISCEKLAADLRKRLGRIEAEAPTVQWIFKGVTYEQTQDDGFRGKLHKALPLAVKKRLGKWYEDFSAAREAPTARANPP